LKPENIVLEAMRSGGDFVKVVDFGLAKMRETASNITSPGFVCGTPDYMAPEQGRGDPIDARSDLYACGVILYQLLTGRLPFEAESPTQVVLMHLSQQPPDMRKAAPERNIPQALVDITLKALSKNADDRYEDAERFIVALREALEPPERSASHRHQWGSAEQGTKCPSCGALVPVAQKFCGECGERVTHGASAGAGEAGGRDRQVHVPKLPLPFTGRDDDLDWLDLQRAEIGSWVTTARLVGEAGVGKTRLLRHFLRAAQGAGDVVVETGPDPWWAEVGYYALRLAIVGLAGLPEDGGKLSDWVGATPEARRGLEAIFGHQQASMEPPPPPWALERDDPAASGARFFASEALRWAMSRAAREADKHSILLAIDDLHAIDGASRNAFLDVAQDPPLVGLLMIATHPPDFDPEWGGPVRELAGLPLAVATSLVRGLGSATPNSDSTGKTILPMYVEQMVRFSLEGGESPAPRLGDLVAQRIERLRADARKMLQAVAVLGDATDPSSLLSIHDFQDLDAVVDELRTAGMLELHDGKIGTTHPLIRDVMLATIPAGVKRELHEHAGIDESGGVRELPTEVLALHGYHGQDSFEALMLLETVATRAAARGDRLGSVLALRRAVEVARRELFRGELDDPVRAVLIFSRKLGEALVRAGDFHDANGVLLEALDLAGPTGRDRVQVLGTLAYASKERARIEEAKRYLAEAIALAKDELLVDLVDSLERARVAWALR
jgi:serine/threonine-protein kinase